MINMPGCGWGSKLTCRRASYYNDLMHMRERTWAFLPHTHTQTHVQYTFTNIFTYTTQTVEASKHLITRTGCRGERGPELVLHTVTKTQIQMHTSTYHKRRRRKERLRQWVSPPHAHIEATAHWMLVHICPAYGWCLASKYSPHLTCNLQSLNCWLGCIWMTGPETFTPFDLQSDQLEPFGNFV